MAKYRYDPDDPTEKLAIKLYKERSSNRTDETWKSACTRTRREYRRQAWERRHHPLTTIQALARMLGKKIPNNATIIAISDSISK